MSLEDDFCDIIKKARMGQGRTLTDVAQSASLPEHELQSLEKGQRPPTATEVQAIGKALEIRTDALSDVAIDGWQPQPPPTWADHEGPVVTVLGDIGGYAVKGYILYDSHTKEAVIIDTAYNADQMLKSLKQLGLRLTTVCLTHGHTDHAGGLDHILAEWPVPVYLGEGDVELLPWKPPTSLLTFPSHGQTISVGTLTVDCLETPGHTPGGFCYRLSGESHDCCFVGDTLFAGSIGRSNPFSLYPAHLESVRQQVLKLPEAMVLLPGHGPATTVQEELTHNPFA